jgi:pimeloyl-ACP methyl ester carboxylesterase
LSGAISAACLALPLLLTPSLAEANGKSVVRADSRSHEISAMVPRPSAVVMVYTAHAEYSFTEPPTFVVVGEKDAIAPPAAMERRIAALRSAGAEVEYRR